MSLVSWSGGCDSTLVLYRLAQDASPSNPVRAVSVDADCIWAAKEQRLARKRILAWMKAKGLHVQAFEMKLMTNAKAAGYGRHEGLKQPTLWLQAQACLAKEEDFFSGYHAGDQFWIVDEHYLEAFRQVQIATYRTGTWRFPLAWNTKAEILAELRKAGLGRLCWWCEDVDKQEMKLKDPLASKPCGRCVPCVTHATAFAQLKIEARGKKPAPTRKRG